MPSPAVNAVLNWPRFILPAGNLNTQPNYVSGWTANASTKINNGAASPNGDWSAAISTEDTASGAHGPINGGACGGGAAGTYIFSFFIKAGNNLLTDRLWSASVFDTPSYAGFARAIFNPRGGAITGNAAQAPFSAVSSWVVPARNRWYRCFIRFTTSGSTGFDPECFTYSIAAASAVFTGDGLCDVYLWGCDMRLA